MKTAEKLPEKNLRDQKYTLCHKKGSPTFVAITLSNRNRFQNSCIDEKRREFPKQRLGKNSPYLMYELRKSYNIDTFIVTWLNYKPLNIVTTFVQSIHPSPAHKHEDGHATRQLLCQ